VTLTTASCSMMACPSSVYLLSENSSKLLPPSTCPSPLISCLSSERVFLYYVHSPEGLSSRRVSGTTLTRRRPRVGIGGAASGERHWAGRHEAELEDGHWADDGET
jgi:hypothetical protein